MESASFEKRLAEAVEIIEDLVEEAVKAEPEVAEDARDAFDAAMPVLDDLQDMLADVDDALSDDE